MVDKLILLDALPVVLDMNVRTGLARPVSLGVWVPGSVFSPAPLGGYQGGRRRWQTVDKRAQGPPPAPEGRVVLPIPSEWAANRVTGLCHPRRPCLWPGVYRRPG